MGAFDPYVAADRRYDAVPSRRVGETGPGLPAVSLGLWHDFGDDKPLQTQRDFRPYRDIFYSHRPDPETPPEENMGAIDEFAVDGDVNIWWGATASTS